MKVTMSICDACSKEVPEDEIQTCEGSKCGGVFCEEHIGDLDHDCPNSPTKEGE